MKQKNKPEELMSILEEIDNNLSVDLVLDPGDTLHFTCNVRNGTLKNWVTAEHCDAVELKPAYRGKSYESLKEAIKRRFKERDARYFSVLCLTESETTLNWDGTLDTKWVSMTPGVPFYVGEDGHPVFDIQEMKLSKKVFRLCLETKMALYDDESGHLYPIKRSALPQFCKILDTSTLVAQSGQESVPLGAAIVFAERIADIPKLRVLYSMEEEDVRPIISVSRTHFRYIPHSEMMRMAYAESKRCGICNLVSWEVSDDRIVMDFLMFSQEPRKILRVCNSYSTGTVMVQALLVFDNCYEVPLKTNTMYHSRKLMESGRKLFDGMYEAFLHWDTLLTRLANQTVCFEDGMYRQIKNALGKTRSEEIVFPTGTKNALEGLYETLHVSYVDSFFGRIKSSRATELQNAWTEFIKQIERRLKNDEVA